MLGAQQLADLPQWSDLAAWILICGYPPKCTPHPTPSNPAGSHWESARTVTVLVLEKVTPSVVPALWAGQAPSLTCMFRSILTSSLQFCLAY